MNKKLFEVQMILHDETQETLGEKIGLKRGSLNKKLNETQGAKFDQIEIKKLIEHWNLTPDEVVAIFFDQTVSKKDTKEETGAENTKEG